MAFYQLAHVYSCKINVVSFYFIIIYSHCLRIFFILFYFSSLKLQPTLSPETSLCWKQPRQKTRANSRSYCTVTSHVISQSRACSHTFEWLQVSQYFLRHMTCSLPGLTNSKQNIIVTRLYRVILLNPWNSRLKYTLLDANSIVSFCLILTITHT